jgi:hypothetical protein
MNLPETVKDRARFIIRSTWVTMGIPFDVPIVNEKREGIIDVEALFMATFLFMEQDRMVTDLPAWIIRFKDIINHQKLKSMFRSCPEKHKRTIFKNLNHDPFGATPESFKRVFGLKNIPTKESVQTIERRLLKLNSLNHVAQTSVMIKNRLLYGTGFRADLISITKIKNIKMNGKQLATLLCTADSTISRILNDLRSCKFLDNDNERIRLSDPYPGMFLSSQTILNLYEIIDAEEFRSKELKKEAYENISFKNDRFCMQLLPSSAPG